eukprot:CAMPEP_0185038980 /NCGR_PEP_ID=MMETSP1103-20130426/35299_1 /TAXON_ID=36769 /ORGANISM="Paraphysomonas bandaiensis, Strain Caron Lab Isolate" /LENGTH=538 /DNA_ID=CAMNT_0027577669 /DNA_START=361 /DNA_END=1974 /DNA_ORIENTATION=-
MNSNQQTDSNGWIYATDFTSDEWSPYKLSDSQVRKRKWQRLLILNEDIHTVREVLPVYYAELVAYRSYHPDMISLALGSNDYVVQIIIEAERLGTNGTYSADNLLLSDPCHWSVGRLSPEKSIICMEKLSYHNTCVPPGWSILHEFMFTLYPGKDPLGWEYSSSFTDNWSREPPPASTIESNSRSVHSGEWTAVKSVRRRIWMRTIVPHSDFLRARSLVSNHISLHPRGNVYRAPILRLRPFSKIWSLGEGILSDDQLTILLDTQETVTVKLRGLEVVSLRPGDHVGCGGGFGLRKRILGNPDNDMICYLSAETAHEREKWEIALTHQLALLDMDFFAVPFGPCIPDDILLTDDMWKRGDFIPSWRLRTIELRQSGTLIYYAGALLKGKVNTNGSVVNKNPVDSGGKEHVFEVITRDDCRILLRAMTSSVKNKWIEALAAFTSQSNIRTDTVLSPSNIESQSSLLLGEYTSRSFSTGGPIHKPVGRMRSTTAQVFPCEENTDILSNAIELSAIYPDSSPMDTSHVHAPISPLKSNLMW